MAIAKSRSEQKTRLKASGVVTAGWAARPQPPDTKRVVLTMGVFPFQKYVPALSGLQSVVLLAAGV